MVVNVSLCVLVIPSFLSSNYSLPIKVAQSNTQVFTKLYRQIRMLFAPPPNLTLGSSFVDSAKSVAGQASILQNIVGFITCHLCSHPLCSSVWSLCLAFQWSDTNSIPILLN